MTNVRTLEKTSVAGPVVHEDKKPSGLCTTCDHRSDCVFAKAEIQPVVFCEEFSDSMAVPTDDGEYRKAEFEGTSRVGPMLKGLCINCDNRNGCVHEKSDGGITYCEEYA